MTMIPLVAQREFSALAHSKAHRITLFLVIALILAAGIVARIFFPADGDSEQQSASPTLQVHLAIEKDMQAFAPAFSALAESFEVTPISGDGEEWVRKQASDSDSGKDSANQDSAAHNSQESGEKGSEKAETEILYCALGGTPASPRVYIWDDSFASSAREATVGTLRQIMLSTTVGTMLESELTPEQQNLLQAANNPTIINVDEEKSVLETNPLGFLVATIMMMMLFFAIMIGMGAIAQGVVEEKSSRIVEILLSSVRPRQLLFGKIIGIGCFVLMELLVWIITMGISLWISGYATFIAALDLHLGANVAWAIVWVILGFFIYNGLVGGVSAMVSRQEDVAAVQMPLIIAALIPVYLSIYLVPYQADKLYTRILSWIPGFSSFMMPMRQGIGNVPLWEVLLALALALLSLPLIAALAGKIYSNSVLRMGSRVSLKTALSSTRTQEK